MNLTFEAILSIFIILLFLTPILYFKNNNSYDKIKDYWVYYYNKVKYNESFRKCLVKENCNLEGVMSFNCTSSDKSNLNFNNKLPKNTVSFYIIGYNSYYCPTLVIFDLDKYNELNLN